MRRRTRRRLKRFFAGLGAALFIFSTSLVVVAPSDAAPVIETPKKEFVAVRSVQIEVEPIFTPAPVETPVVEELPLTQEEIELIAQVTMAEAEGEPEEGQRLVIDTILNRVDDPHFPDTVYDVVYQKNQFTCMWNGRFDACYVKDELVDLVAEELRERTNLDVVFFRTRQYSAYGVPMFQVGHHYFSSYS